MKDAAISISRRAHLFKLWDNLLSNDTLPQVDKWLSDEFKRNSKYGSKDRRWYSEAIFSGIRFAFFAIWCEKINLQKNFANFDAISKSYLEHKFLASLCSEPNMLFSILRNIPAPKLFYWIELRHGFVNSPNNCLLINSISAADKNLFEQFATTLLQSNSLESQLIWESIPIWYTEYFQNRVNYSKWNFETQKHFLSQQNIRPPLWLRINHPLQTQNCIKILQQENFTVTNIDQALQVIGNNGIFVSQAYREGLIEIQDYGSQQAGNKIAAKPGQLVWDACAGGGGKTIQIAAKLANKGAVYASDIREYKLDEVKKRARRAGFFNVRCLPWNGVLAPDFPREVSKQAGFHWVLVDAPCSSSGTWRRNPDAKYRITSANIDTLNILQLNLMNNACKHVIVGGHLVYSTCSFFTHENEDIVQSFVAQNPNFAIVSMDLVGHPFTDSDTLFSAVLLRKA